MKELELCIGSSGIKAIREGGTGEFVQKNNETFYKITGVDSLSPFFMTVVSHSDHWMFISSTGGLSAGRKNPESALFPYYTDDKIIDRSAFTGSKTLLKIQRDGKLFLWEPFTNRYEGIYDRERNLYKNITGNKLIFEEVNNDLKISFQYHWTFSQEFGFVKESSVSNWGDATEINVLDGIRDLLPYGVNSQLQLARSTLVDAYKKNELEAESGLAIFSLSSMIVDRAEPSEALRATTVWSRGLENPKHLLSDDQLNRYRRGGHIEEETFTKAGKAAYFVGADIELQRDEKRSWVMVAEVNQSSAKVIDLNNKLLSDIDILEELQLDVERSTVKLQSLVGLADGLQLGKDRLCTGRHFSNVLFNIMRGGIFEDQYQINVNDLEEYCQQFSPTVYRANEDFFVELPLDLSYQELVRLAKESGTEDLQRICVEYLPLSFSRRHGDPSRPWNNFNIDIQDEKGRKRYYYEGNWRDIFQNWEALAYSFPEYIEGMITKFVNASTIDGYNPYRITRDGIDWETIEPDDPWSYIGYWGDHQIIYLQKLLEHAENHYPGMLLRMLQDSSFVYANVPYKIRGYQAIVQDPNSTIDFDYDQAHRIDQLVKAFGADGKIVRNGHNTLTANLSEKLLVMLLTKLYNFIPDGGIWLNTQRPEWNDANNALVGNGVSMTTLNYLSRAIRFVHKLFESFDGKYLEMHVAVDELMHSVLETFKTAPKTFDPIKRKQFIDALGIAGETYRTKAYAHFQGGAKLTEVSHIIELLSVAQSLVDQTILNSRRGDGLYHAYNLLTFDNRGAHVSHLYEMLEGQVAALSSGLLAPAEVVNVLDSLKNSEMYREDQYSYMLYPNRVLKSFISKNSIPADIVDRCSLIHGLSEIGHTQLVEKDAAGAYHFSGDLHNEHDVRRELEHLRESDLIDLKEQDAELLLEGFERVFNHVAFTGRSGTMYGYEGLGSIYWHMVSKLLLATHENIFKAQEQNADEAVIGKLLDHYYEIRAGIGINKEPKLYGAFPTDAYSHSPDGSGVRQPGLTGQVKEDVLNRWAELGVRVQNGRIIFNPLILDKAEFLEEKGSFTYFRNAEEPLHIEVHAGEIAFTYCGVLIRYRQSDQSAVHVTHSNGESTRIDELTLSKELSQKIFERSNDIKEVMVEGNFGR